MIKTYSAFGVASNDRVGNTHPTIGNISFKRTNNTTEEMRKRQESRSTIGAFNKALK